VIGKEDLDLTAPFGPRDDRQLAAELARLTRSHADRLPAYRRIIAGNEPQTHIEDVPYLHVALFKHPELFPAGSGFRGRRVASSSTSTGIPSIVNIDAKTARLQEQSTRAILSCFLPDGQSPLIVMDAPSSLRGRDVSARVAAAMALRSFASDMHWVMGAAEDASSVDWRVVEEAAGSSDTLVFYGFTWVLWKAFTDGMMTAGARRALASTRATFVHSGGWKRLEAESVAPHRLSDELLSAVAEGSSVLDYYGLVEQLGVVFPQCPEGRRHVPRWSKVLVRDPWTGATAQHGEIGALQLLSPLALTSPTHSVLTEDLGYRFSSPCPCGLEGDTFVLEGRIPRAEVRGCANVSAL
jgi:hypothetical protein